MSASAKELRPLVVAAFEPFGGRRRNRAEDAAARLAGVTLAGRPLEVARVPTVFAELPATLDALLEKRPAVLLLVGEAASARTLLVERLAVNVAHTHVPDNAGVRLIDEQVEPGGELARQVAFDPRILANAALAAGVPCKVSSHAGTFCCNAALYHALGRASGETTVAFVHVPARWPWARDGRAARGLLAVFEALTARTSH